MEVNDYIKEKCSNCLRFNEYCWHYENLGDISESSIDRCEKLNLFRHKSEL